MSRATLSDGKRHSAEIWEWLNEALYDRLCGGTEAPGLYDGFYRDPDTQKRVGDQSRKFIVAVTASQLVNLRELLSDARVVFQQKCIYLSVAGKVEIIEAADHDTNQSG